MRTFWIALVVCSLALAGPAAFAQQRLGYQSRHVKNAAQRVAQPPQAAVETLPPPGPAPAKAQTANGTQSESDMQPAAAGAGTLDLETLQTLASQNNPSLREAWAQLEAARGRWVQAGLKPNPTVGYSGQQLGSNATEQNGVLVGQEFITGGKLRLDQGVASQEIERAHQQMHAQHNRVLTDVTIAYYEALAAQQRVQLTAQLTQLSQRSVESVQSLLQANEATRIELLQAQIEAQSAQISAENARNRAAAAWRSLAAVVGLPTLTPQPLVGALDDVPADLTWESSRAHILGESPELTIAAADAERARWAYQRALQQVVPNVDVQTVVQYDEDVEQVDGNLQISIPLPLFNRNQGGIREAYANIAASEQAMERVQLRLEQRLASVYERYANALQQVKRYRREVLPASQEQLSLIAEAYRAGEGNYTSLLIAQRTYFQTHLSALDAQRELAVAASEIHGLLLTESLSESPADR
jgi:cobalt-zinc-cadmium efflux system outer membrane protein